MYSKLKNQVESESKNVYQTNFKYKSRKIFTIEVAQEHANEVNTTNKLFKKEDVLKTILHPSLKAIFHKKMKNYFIEAKDKINKYGYVKISVHNLRRLFENYYQIKDLRKELKELFKYKHSIKLAIDKFKKQLVNKITKQNFYSLIIKSNVFFFDKYQKLN